MVRDLIVHTRRYSSHTNALPIDPQTQHTSEPVPVRVEVPRAQFHAEELVPVYITISPPSKEVLVGKTLRLRNVKAEIIRTIRVEASASEGKTPVAEYQDGHASPYARGSSPDEEGPSSACPKSGAFEKAPVSEEALSGDIHTATIAKSGAGCRFHPTQPVKLRLLLRQTSPTLGLQPLSSEPATSTENINSHDADCPAITQSTLLHSVTFALHIIVSFLDMKNHVERSTTLLIPLTIVPAPAPLPEVDDSVGVAYQKKHDRPPTRTVRHEDYDLAPSYPGGGGEAGPSGIQQGAPPPFEERDAPPPFFLSSAMEASSSSRLPTFLESEEEVIFPSSSPSPTIQHGWAEIPGEGVQFGFASAAQFDGYSDGIQQPSEPLPSHELASQAGSMNDLSHDLDVQMVLQPAGSTSMEEMPPPPPAMDDPSDPPPSIDSDFRSPSDGLRNQGGQSPPPMRAHYDHGARNISPPASRRDAPPSTGNHAPPPYATPNAQPNRDEDQVARPPPYVDFGSPRN